ncbi:WGR domain-containing protein [Leptospira alstonii]|uniref:WGR domain protein n=2 Tax=Leptospira alstonii TaxID=28452 RepID=M6CYY1_9LEPT|nr:WGR domain-containing protein [Leptospira alstonii]EMJ94143.1 WGR domain protein [Leptospira alstonii serovar Sichuan str. 79601]EQA79222.1 WGR domain protein [Leptospira alstonii serovar Pingchang str. 80-412]
MKHHLTYQDKTSHKFWNIEVSGKSFTVTFGKAGTDGQTQTKTFDDEEKCLKEAKKLLAEKLKKGYIDRDKTGKTARTTDATQSDVKDHLKEWEKIVRAEDFRKTLIQHFAYLADTEGYHQVLTSIINLVEKVQIENESLTLLFNKGFQWIAGPPGDKKNYTKWPETFQEKMIYHSSLALIDENRTGIFLQEIDLDPVDDLELDETELNEYPLKLIKIPMSDFSDCWLYHPKEKNSSNEPSLIFFDHGGILDFTPDFNIGAAFLKRSAQLLGLNSESEPAKKTETNRLEIKKTGTLVLTDVTNIRYIRSFVFPEQKLLVAKVDSQAINSDRLAYYDIQDPSRPILLKSEKEISFEKARMRENILELLHGHCIYFVKSEDREFHPLKKIDGPMHGARVYQDKIYFSNSVVQWRGLHIYDLKTETTLKLDDAMNKYKSHVEAADICIGEDLLWLVGLDEVILYQLQASSVKRIILKSHNTIFEPEVIAMLDKNRIVVAEKNEDPDGGFALHLIVYSDKKINTPVRFFPKKGVVAWQRFQNRFYFVLLSRAKNTNNYSFAIWEPDTNHTKEYQLPDLVCKKHFAQGVCAILMEQERAYLYKNDGEIFTITGF